MLIVLSGLTGPRPMVGRAGRRASPTVAIARGSRVAVRSARGAMAVGGPSLAELIDPRTREGGPVLGGTAR